MIVEQFSRTIKKFANFLGGKSEEVGDTFNSDIKVFSMRGNQSEVFNNFRDSIRFLLTQPPGSGKSAIINFIMAYRLLHSKDHKVIIAVPQTLIAKSFGKAILKYDDGSIIHWDILNDLCGGKYTKKQKMIEKFLKKKNFTNNNNERVLITTHQALATVFSKAKLTMEDFDNTSVVIDEAHHILYSDFISNQIGQMVRTINGNQSSSLWFVTATPFRGDKNNIIPKEEFDKFDKFYLPLDKHWRENIKHIESFNFSFVIYKKDELFNDFETIMKNKKKTIIFCPFNGRLVRKKNKHVFKKEIIERILKVWPECEIVDLIDTKDREKKKLDLLDNDKAKKVDVILTLKIFDEGTDWIPAEQCVDFCPPESLRIMYQRFGRLWRDLFEKINISYYCFLPFTTNFKNEEERRDHLSKSYCAFVASLLLQEMVDPIPYPVKEEKSEEKKNKQQYKLNPFEAATKDDAEQQEILEEVIKKLIIVASYNENPTKKEVYDHISSILTEHNIIEEQKDVIIHIAKILRRQHELLKPSWKEQTVDVSWMANAGFDEIIINNIFKSLLMFGTKTCGIEHFEMFRKVYNGNKKTLEEAVKDAERLEREYGELPNTGWLKENECEYINYHIYQHPEAFKHIKQSKHQHKILEEVVKDAEELEKKFGKLPNQKWLRDNRYGYINYYMKIYPEAFKHIKQKKFKKTLEEAVKDAEELEKKFGELLNQKWLEDNGYDYINYYMRKHPEAFKHIKQTRLNKFKNSLEKAIKDAEELEKKFGKLPTKIWLRKNEYNYINYYMRKHPEAFKHIKQSKPHKTLEEVVKDAEELEKKFGELPNYLWLRENGYNYINHYLSKYPEAFKHIKQKKLINGSSKHASKPTL